MFNTSVPWYQQWFSRGLKSLIAGQVSKMHTIISSTLLHLKALKQTEPVNVVVNQVTIIDLATLC